MAKVKPATVYITTESSSGSGMIFTTDGYVLTNEHVVSGFTTVKVSLSTGEIMSGSVLGRNELIDLAVIKLNTTKQLSKIDFGDSDKVQQGDEVFTFGFPFGIEGDVSFKEGTISRRIETYFETSAEIHPGNSGGPLVNRYGQVIGVNTAIYGKSISGVQLGETIKLAIPINIAKNIISDLKAGKTVIDEATRVKEAEEERKIEEAKQEAERIASETAAKIAEENRKIEEENERIEAQILARQQCVQNKNAITTEYNTKKLYLEQQIINRKSKYYTDYAALNESFKGRMVTKSGVQWEFDALLREANADIERWNLELSNLYIEYSSKLNQFQC
ncbi:MAG: trypsin-like peptidase domain-containing protein [Candidatus Paceibacterota bacterium]